MKTVVTGAAGFIGSHLTERLLEEGEEVVAIDNLHPNYSSDLKQHNIRKIRGKAENSPGNFELLKGSILKKEDLEKLPEKPKHVYHLAALAGVRQSVKKPQKYIKTNVKGTSKLLNRFKDTEKFIYFSSSSVYGELKKDKLPVKESQKLDPKNPYAASKKQGEQLVKTCSDLHNTEHAIIRPFTVYGPRQRPGQAITKFITQALEEKAVTVYGDGKQTRDFTHIEDVIQGTVLAAEKGEGVYNIGTGRRITVNRMVETLEKVMNQTIEKKYIEKPEADVKHTHADITKAEKLGYKPQKTFEQGTRESVNWVRQMKQKKKVERLKSKENRFHS